MQHKKYSTYTVTKENYKKVISEQILNRWNELGWFKAFLTTSDRAGVTFSAITIIA